MNTAAGQWSQQVTNTSTSLELEEGVFTWHDPTRIARSLLRSAEKSSKRRSSPYRSAMSMLSFYVNRGGKLLPKQRRRTLEEAKRELRKLAR